MMRKPRTTSTVLSEDNRDVQKEHHVIRNLDAATGQFRARGSLSPILFELFAREGARPNFDSDNPLSSRAPQAESIRTTFKASTVKACENETTSLALQYNKFCTSLR